MSCITVFRSPWHLASSQIPGGSHNDVASQQACSFRTPILPTSPRKDVRRCNKNNGVWTRQRLVYPRAMLNGGHQETAAGPTGLETGLQLNLIPCSKHYPSPVAQQDFETREGRETQGCQTEVEQIDMDETGDLPLKRRTAALAFSAVASPLFWSGGGSALAEEATSGSESSLTLIPYENKKDGFSILRPDGWEIVEKAGATLLIEDPRNRKNSIGVVVSPVRIDSLNEFGDAKSVGEKLLAAERKKGSTNSATMLRIDVRTAPTAGAPLYVLEYVLDSSRGVKRTLTAVTIVRKKLFIVNIAYPDSPKAPAPAPLANALHEVLDSFDVER